MASSSDPPAVTVPSLPPTTGQEDLADTGIVDPNGLRFHETPSSETDPIGVLPVAEPTSTLLLIETMDEANRWTVVDLWSGTWRRLPTTGSAASAYLPNGSASTPAFLPDGDVVSAAGPRTFAVWDHMTGRDVRVDLPAEVVGDLVAVEPAAGGLIVTMRTGADSKQSAVVELDGRLRCAPSDLELSWQEVGGGWWSFDNTVRFDPRTCASSVRLVPGDGWSMWEVFTVGEDGVVAAVYPADGRSHLASFDPRTGALVTVAPGDLVAPSDARIGADGVWAVGGQDLVVLEPVSLREIDRARVSDCDDGQRFVEHRRSTYLLDESCATFVQLDSTGHPVQGWYLPHDGFSDTEVYPFAAAEGIWMIDSELMEDPYVFDMEDQRFERAAPGALPPEVFDLVDVVSVQREATPSDPVPSPQPSSPVA